VSGHRSIVGKLLSKRKNKPTDITPPPTTTQPKVDPEANNKVQAARLKVQEQIDKLGLAIKALHFAALKTPLDKLATTLRGQMSTLDTLPDASAKAHRLMQLGDACGKVMQEALKVKLQDSQLHQTQVELATAVLNTENLLGEITVEKAREPFTLRLQTAKQEQTDAINAIEVSGLLKLTSLVNTVNTIQQDATPVKDKMVKVAGEKKNWADDPLDALERNVKKASSGVKSAMAGDVTTAKNHVKTANTEFNKGDFDKASKAITSAYWACDAANKRLEKLNNLAELKTSHDSAKVQQGLLTNHPDFDTAFKKMKGALDAAILRADPVLLAGEGVNKDTLFDMVLDLGGAERAARKSLAEYDSYKLKRVEIEKLVAELKKHKQATAITSEIAQIEQALTDAHTMGAKANGGWHRAKAALQLLPKQCQGIEALADKLELSVSQLPALTSGLESKGVKTSDMPKLLNMAHKLIVEENCTPDEAVDMAQSAGKFTQDGLDEPDALISSRLKHSLMKGDDALDEGHAHAVGRSVRCRGSATIDDVKCVASGMKLMSASVLEDLNDAGITTGICQGPVTDMIPDLCDVNPRGWGSKTWDDVPGVYMGSKKMVVVGTMDDGGKRKVPGPSEGPVKHGTPDLLGHEAGHAYDVVGGVAKRNHVKFVKARSLDLLEPTDVKLKPGRDDYFMTKTESTTGKQSTDDAARSETFAESFALHFANNTSKWPNLKSFWETNPWGA